MLPDAGFRYAGGHFFLLPDSANFRYSSIERKIASQVPRKNGSQNGSEIISVKFLMSPVISANARDASGMNSTNHITIQRPLSQSSVHSAFFGGFSGPDTDFSCSSLSSFFSSARLTAIRS